MSELLPCPHCGAKAWERSDDWGMSRIECDDCQTGQLGYQYFDKAAEDWNRRAALSQANSTTTNPHSLHETPPSADKPAGEKPLASAGDSSGVAQSRGAGSSRPVSVSNPAAATNSQEQKP